MKILFLFFGFLFLVNSSFGQKILTYEGPYQNGLPYPATSRYNYYLDKSGQKVMHGSFRYLVKEKTQTSRIMHNFSGNYAHGMKSGKWEYVIKTKDAAKQGSDVLESMDIQLFANYNKGVPEGKWVFMANVSQRRKVVNGGKESFVDFKTVKDLKIVVNFKNGVLIDSLYIFDNLADSILLIADENGVLNGDLVKAGYNEVYVSGLLKSRNGKENSQYVPLNKLLVTGADNVKIDTITALNRNELNISKYLNDNIFNNEYFLFTRISGDAIVTKTANGLVKSIDIKGLYILMIKPNISENQAKYLASIEYYNIKLLEYKKQAEIALRRKPDDKTLKSEFDQLNAFYTKSQSYLNTAKLASKYILLEDIKREAALIINPLPTTISKAKSMEEVLKVLANESKSLYDLASKIAN